MEEMLTPNDRMVVYFLISDTFYRHSSEFSKQQNTHSFNIDRLSLSLSVSLTHSSNLEAVNSGRNECLSNLALRRHWMIHSLPTSGIRKSRAFFSRDALGY